MDFRTVAEDLRNAIRDFLGRDGHVCITTGDQESFDILYKLRGGTVLQPDTNSLVACLQGTDSVFLHTTVAGILGFAQPRKFSQVWVTAMDADTGYIVDPTDLFCWSWGTQKDALRVLDLGPVAPWRDCRLPDPYPVDAVVLRASAFGLPPGLGAIWTPIIKIPQPRLAHQRIDGVLLETWARELRKPNRESINLAVQRSRDSLLEVLRPFKAMHFGAPNTVVVPVPIHRALVWKILESHDIMAQGACRVGPVGPSPFMIRECGSQAITLSMREALRPQDITRIHQALRGLDNYADIQEILEKE